MLFSRCKNIINVFLSKQLSRANLKAFPKPPPKHPVSSFHLFAQEFRETLPPEQRPKRMPVLNSLASEEWKKLDKSKKEFYMQRAREKHNEYKIQMTDYFKSLSVDETRAYWEKVVQRNRLKRHKKVLKELEACGAPKGPKPAYVLFALEQRYPGTCMVDNLKRLSSVWRAMSDKEKEPYILTAREDMERYQREFLEWAVRTKAAGREDLVEYEKLRRRGDSLSLVLTSF